MALMSILLPISITIHCGCSESSSPVKVLVRYGLLFQYVFRSPSVSFDHASPLPRVVPRCGSGYAQECLRGSGRGTHNDILAGGGCRYSQKYASRQTDSDNAFLHDWFSLIAVPMKLPRGPAGLTSAMLSVSQSVIIVPFETITIARFALQRDIG